MKQHMVQSGKEANVTEKLKNFIAWAENKPEITIPDLDCFYVYQKESKCEDLTDDEKDYLIKVTKMKIKQMAYTKRIDPSIARLILGSEYGISETNKTSGVVNEEYVTIVMDDKDEKSS